MALRDVRNFQFFKEAVVQRFRNPNLKSFKGIPYEPQTNPQTIFGRIYNTFRELIGKGLSLHQYLNIGERSILENLYRNLQRDPNLKFLNKPDAALNDPRLALSDQYYQEQPQAIAATQQAESTQIPTEQPGAMPSISGLPSAPSISSGPRRVYNIPQAPEPPKPEIAIANKSGVVAEKPPSKSELVTANKSGVVKETPTGSKLVTANSSGTLKGLGGEAPTKQIFIANKGGVVTGVCNIKPPGWLKTFGSNAQIFAKKNLGRIAGGLTDIAKGIGRGIGGPALTGTYNLLGKAGNGGLNVFERLSNPGLRGASRSFVSSGSKKLAWGLVGALVFIVIGAGLIGGLPGGGTTPGTDNVGIGTTAALISPTGIQPRPAAPIIDPSGLRQAIIEKFGITMNGYDNDHLRWAWDKFWDVSNTNFISFIRGSVITIDSGSRQVGCPGEAAAVYLDQYPETLFKYALTHELGHVIKNCLNSTANFVADFFNAFNKEKGVTYYANNASICTRSDNQSEDYAEMVALYLNPNADIQMTKCATDAGVTKYTNLKTDFPLHYNVARSVLGDY